MSPRRIVLIRWTLLVGLFLAANARAQDPENLFRCNKCLKTLSARETELQGHPYDPAHDHPTPCQVRVHQGCGQIITERKKWDARHRSNEDKEFTGAAGRCGSEIPWLDSLEEARRRARETGKPIAWWVASVAGSRMDRKVVLRRYMQAGPFMMPGVIRLLSDHFVPLRRGAEEADRERFALGTLEFVEPGLIFLDADLNLLHKVSGLTTFSEEWFVHLLAGVLGRAGRDAVKIPKPEFDPGRRAISEGRPDPSLFDGLDGSEARYFRGVALHLTGRDEEGRAEWRKIQEGRWAWKAAAELTGEGPFVRGFEVYEFVRPSEGPVPESTTFRRPEPDVARAVRFLLGMQREGGGWSDSNYNYGGDESLANVHMAVTALAALALREWGDRAMVRAALERAERYLRDETRVAPEDADEIVWAHACRLLYFARSGDRPLMARLIRKLADLQMESGIWYHEYPGPSASVLALHALGEAKKAGADVPAVLLHRGAKALGACRDAGGVFSYRFPALSHSVENGAGRMPFCEAALFSSGMSTREKVDSAVETSFSHHSRLERVRKYDQSADPYKNAGYYFWFCQYGRAVAAKAIGSASGLRRQRDIVLSTAEVDGCWVDSPELGRTYATALALLTLKLCEE